MKAHNKTKNRTEGALENYVNGAPLTHYDYKVIQFPTIYA